MNTNMNWFAISVRSGPLGVPGNSIYNIQKKIMNDPFFGIYKIEIIGEGTVTPEVLLYAKSSKKDPNKLDEKVEQFLRSNMVGAASSRVIRGGVPEVQADINIANLDRFKAIVAGEDPGAASKQAIINLIRTENLRLAELATVHVKTISQDEQKNLYLVADIGYSSGLIKQGKFDSLTGAEDIPFKDKASPIEKMMGLSINNINLISTPVSEEKKIPLPDGNLYMNQERLTEYNDLIENKAKNMAKELWEQHRNIESSYIKFVYNDIREKYAVVGDEFSQSKKQDQDITLSNVDKPSSTIQEQNEPIKQQEIEIPKYTIVDSGINFGKQGNIKLHVAIQVEGITEEPEVAIIDVSSDQIEKYRHEKNPQILSGLLKPQTFDQLVTPEGFDYIADILDNTIDNYIGIVSKDIPWKGDVTDKVITPTEGRELSKEWNARYYFYLREINIRAL